MNKLLIGTSGFSYNHWTDVFYPQDLASDKRLNYYSQHFNTVEINSSFYRIPRQTTLAKWQKQVSKDFVFSIKAYQGTTHWKKLNLPAKYWPSFWESVKTLPSLGVILVQLPPNWQANADRLTAFLNKHKTKIRFAFEFRHQTWFRKEILRILKAFNCALVFHDCQQWPIPPHQLTADFVYLRFHGVEAAYNYQYSQQQIEDWAKKIKIWQKQGLDIFAYFNNDVDGLAVKNANQLKQML
jgi:uncharacterized protein YecE (DUF72 family)